MSRRAPNPIPRALRPRDARPSWLARLSSPLRCLPDLLVIGAQKAGTTSLHAHLDAHPRIWMARCKECNHLTGSPPTRLGYRAFFLRSAVRRAAGIAVVGETTPYYLFHPAAPRRAAALAPRVRAIAVLRDPVARAWSHYRHNVRLGIEPLEPLAALDAEPGRTAGELERVAATPWARSDVLRHFSYAARGRYAEQLERWFAALGRERVLVLLFESLVERPRETMSAVARFLEMPDEFGAELPARNVGADGASIPDAVRRRLRAEFEAPNRALATLLDVNLPWEDAVAGSAHGCGAR